MKFVTAILMSIVASSGVAWAQSSALIIGNEDYSNVSDVRRGDTVIGAANAFEGAGVNVVSAREADVDEIATALGRFGQAVPRAERQIVVLSGRFAHSQTDTYFLATDTGPGPLSRLSKQAVPLSVVLAYLAETPGHSILALATDAQSGAFGDLMQIGIGDIDVPQGVTIARGTPRDMARFLTRTLARPGLSIATGANSHSISIHGYLENGQTFLPEPEPEPEATKTEPATLSGDARLRDLLAWRSADSSNTAEAYQEYIDTHPDGQFVRMAENRIQALVDTPEARAERAEQALDLNREKRRDIQRDLSLLDYNTRGIDGIFGRGTRAAISSWQSANGFDSTGFLTREQITRLDAQADRRSAELEAEAERRRQEQLAADRTFWSETGSIGDEAGYRVYLERFPDGEFSDIARARLEEIERQKRAETDARDRQLWDEARTVNSTQAYRDYLELAPGGAFREEAQQRINLLEREANLSDEQQRARQEEQALNMNTSTRRVIESRLDRLGLKPGRVDGNFDDDTRRAIRRYQAARNLPSTGYLNEAVVVQLLADSVRSIFR